MKAFVRINADECKGCGLCVAACTFRALRLSDELNRYGYHPAVFSGDTCTGCGLCFYTCPEPGSITVVGQALSLRRPLRPPTPVAA